jgi:hypothetical protein
MKKLIVPAVLLLMTGTATLAQDKVIAKYANTIKADDLKKHLTFIASDSLKGRDTGSPEQKVAAQYIANHFESVGLKGIVGADKSHFQLVDLVKRGWGEFYIKSNTKTYVYLQDFIASNTAPINTEEKVDLVFVGYGIDESRLSDYATMDVKGKVIVAFDGEPRNTDGTYVLSGSTKLQNGVKLTAGKIKWRLLKKKEQKL